MSLSIVASNIMHVPAMLLVQNMLQYGRWSSKSSRRRTKAKDRCVLPWLAACPALLYPDRQRLFRRAAVLLEARRCCAFRRARIFFSLLRWSAASIFLLPACSAATRLAGLRNSQCFVPAAR